MGTDVHFRTDFYTAQSPSPKNRTVHVYGIQRMKLSVIALSKFEFTYIRTYLRFKSGGPVVTFEVNTKGCKSHARLPFIYCTYSIYSTVRREQEQHRRKYNLSSSPESSQLYCG
jgi:hypothetical protein